jgi:RNA polymerase sigma-70 factor (ECF subfamily)
VALRYTGTPYDAEDMVQETMSIALNKMNKLRDDSKCKSWLFAILRSIFLRGLNKNSRKKNSEYDENKDYVTFLEEAAESFDIEKALEKKIEKAQIEKILSKLPEKFKSPIILHYIEDLPYREISKYLEIPVGTVMSRLSRAKALIKKELIRYLMIKDSTEDIGKLSKIDRNR